MFTGFSVRVLGSALGGLHLAAPDVGTGPSGSGEGAGPGPSSGTSRPRHTLGPLLCTVRTPVCRLPLSQPPGLSGPFCSCLLVSSPRPAHMVTVHPCHPCRTGARRQVGPSRPPSCIQPGRASQAVWGTRRPPLDSGFQAPQGPWARFHPAPVPLRQPL